MKFLGTEINPIGLGCWPMGGAMFAGDGQSLGYSKVDDQESLRAIHAAVANGIALFDTAAAYGAGHSERQLAVGLKAHPDAKVVTKIGIKIDENTKTLVGEEVAPELILPAVERCLSRLERDSIDLLLLHNNSLSVDKAALAFDELDKAVAQGKIQAYGWSTDFTKSAEEMAAREGFKAVEYAMHVLMDAPTMQATVRKNNLHSLIRSPLAMGLLSGKYDTSSVLPNDDIRATNQGWLSYYVDGKPNPTYIDRFNAVRELLQTGGRTPVQGALAWLWAKSGDNIPIPGARTVDQVEGLAKAVALGPLPENVTVEIAELVGGENESDGMSER